VNATWISAPNGLGKAAVVLAGRLARAGSSCAKVVS